MVRLWVVLAVVVVVFTVYAFVDCLLSERTRVRGLPKPVWVIVILLVPPIGGILWLTIGRARRSPRNSRFRSSAPDDDPDFLRTIGVDPEQRDRIRRLEQEIADLDDRPDTDPPGRRDG